MNSIRKKIISSYILIIVVTVIIIEAVLYMVIKTYYYNNLKDTINGQMKISSDFYNTYLSSNTVKENVFNNADVFWSNTKCEVQIVDSNGYVIMDSLGNISGEPLLTTEVKEVLNGRKRSASSIYKTKNSRDKCISTAMPLYYDTGINGVLRFTSSTKAIDRGINKLSAGIMLLGMVVILVASTVSIFMANSIMKPLRLVSLGAEKMAKGNFKETIPKYSKDEIGSLADTLNYMSGEILKNEKLKNEFISSVSHELRTPLTSIKGWTIVLASSDLNDKEEMEEGLKIINEEVERLSFLVEELLDFSKMVSAKMVINKERTEIYGFINSILAQLRPRFNSHNIHVEFKCEEELYLYIDKNRIRQVFINILDNSLKNSPVNSNIFIEVNPLTEVTVIKIRDTGYGIPQNELPHVKDKFFKGSNNKAGYGIGLSVCEEIINSHGGKLNLTSILNKGTTVSISLPMGEEI